MDTPQPEHGSTLIDTGNCNAQHAGINPPGNPRKRSGPEASSRACPQAPLFGSIVMLPFSNCRDLSVPRPVVGTRTRVVPANVRACGWCGLHIPANAQGAREGTDHVVNSVPLREPAHLFQHLIRLDGGGMVRRLPCRAGLRSTDG